MYWLRSGLHTYTYIILYPTWAQARAPGTGPVRYTYLYMNTWAAPGFSRAPDFKGTNNIYIYIYIIYISEVGGESAPPQLGDSFVSFVCATGGCYMLCHGKIEYCHAPLVSFSTAGSFYVVVFFVVQLLLSVPPCIFYLLGSYPWSSPKHLSGKQLVLMRTIRYFLKSVHTESSWYEHSGKRLLNQFLKRNSWRGFLACLVGGENTQRDLWKISFED